MRMVKFKMEDFFYSEFNYDIDITDEVAANDLQFRVDNVNEEKK